MDVRLLISPLTAGLLLTAPAEAGDREYRLLATTKTSSMEKEMGEAAQDGYRFEAVMGGDTSFGGSEVVVIMARKTPASPGRFSYKLLATSKTFTMQKELREAAEKGFEYHGQTVFESTVGGKEVAIILERDRENEGGGFWDYRLLATRRTSTMQKELRQAAQAGFELVGLTVGATAFGGHELVCIVRRRAE